MRAFNLLHEPWIPCVDERGALVHRGIVDTLRLAHQTQEIADASPIVVAALHRLLLAVLHRVLGPPNAEFWAAMWDERQFGMGEIETYLKQWEERFFLFHEEFPFYQTPGIDDEDGRRATTIAKLIHSRSSGNNSALFDHSMDDAPDSISPAEAARWLVAMQSYDLSGTTTHDVGVKSAISPPILKGAMILIQGNTLFETLMLNLVAYSPEEGASAAPFAAQPDDCPAWERPQPTQYQERLPLGYLDYLTWQSRRFLLLPEQQADGSIRVPRVIRMIGYELPRGTFQSDYEQMFAYRAKRQAKAAEDPYLPLGFSLERALWRDSLTLIESMQGQAKAEDGEVPARRRPQVMSWVQSLIVEGYLPRSARYRIAAYGMCSDSSAIYFWRQERFPLPLHYLSPEAASTRRILGQCVEYANRVGGVLESTAREMALALLRRNAGDNGKGPDRDMIARTEKRFVSERAFWPLIEASFRQLMTELTDASEDERVSLVQQWEQEVRRAAEKAHGAVLAKYGMTGKSASLIGRAEDVFQRNLARESKTFRKKEIEPYVTAA